MVFKPTQGRKVFTQPTGMPDLSGFKSAAKSYQQLGGIIAEFGTQKRVGDYNEAVRQAQIDGKTAGVKYTKGEDGQWKLSPLVNLDYSKAVQGLPEQDRQGVLDAHRQAAVGTYVAAAVNDINSAATRSLIANPNNPDQVRADMNGYAQGLRDSVDESIYAQIAPKIEASFLSAENQAFAQQQKDITATGISELTKKFNSNTTDLGKLYAVGPDEDDDTSVEGLEMRISDILEEDEVTLKHLETLGVNADKIEELRNNRANNIAVRVGQEAVGTAFESGGFPAAMNLAMEAVEQNLDSDVVDSQVLGTALFRTAERLEQLRQAGVTYNNRLLDEISSNIRYQMVVGKQDINEMLLDPNHPIHSLKGSVVASLFQEGKGVQAGLASEAYNENIGFLTNWKTFNNEEDRRLITDGYLNLRQQWLVGDLTPTQWGNAKALMNEYTDHVLNSENRREIGMAMVMALGPNSTFDKTPAVYAKLMPSLIEKGVIGKNGVYKTEQQFISVLDRYSEAWDKHDKMERAAQRGFGKLRRGIALNDDEQEAVDNIYGTNKAIVGTEIIDMDFFSDDGAVVQASVDTADAYTHRFNGLIHPEARVLFKNYMNNEAAANMAAKVLSQMATGLVNSDEYTFMNEGQALDHIWQINDFSSEARKFFQIATNSTVELAMEAGKWDKRTEAERNLTDIVMPGISDDLNKAERADAFFDKAVKDSLGAFGFDNFVDFDQQGPVVQQMLEDLASGTGIDVDDLADVVIGDRDLRKQMKDLFYERYIYEHKLGMKPKDTMRSVFASFGTRYGFEKDPETGQVLYVKNPILAHAQATIPNQEKGTFRGKPIFKINRDMLVQDFAYRMGGVGEAVPKLLPANHQQDMRDLMLPEDNLYKANIRFIANEVAAEGNIPTYSVYLTDRHNVTKMYSNSYRFEYATSHLSDDYDKAMSEVKNGTVKQILRIGNAFDPMLVQAQLNKYAKSRNKNDLYPLIDLVNTITGATAGTGFDISDFRFSDEDGDDLINLRESFYSLGTY